MSLRRRCLRLAAMAIVVSLPLLGTSGIASAKAGKGCHKTHTCKSDGGSPTGSGTGAGPAPITVQVDPSPVVETYQADIIATVQVETSPSFAGETVDISSSQLTATCVAVEFNSIPGVSGITHASVTLDADGNATIFIEAVQCAPGSDVVEADLEAAPYYTALGLLDASPPVVTPSGVFGYPTTSGTVMTGEVETGDTPTSGDSDVYAVFYVETDPVYAEQPVEISSPELESRCGGGWNLSSFTVAPVSSNSGTVGPPLTSILDDDGNAVFLFLGVSCAAGSSEVVADVLAGSHPTYTTTFNILAPQPTI